MKHVAQTCVALDRFGTANFILCCLFSHTVCPSRDPELMLNISMFFFLISAVCCCFYFVVNTFLQ